MPRSMGTGACYIHFAYLAPESYAMAQNLQEAFNKTESDLRVIIEQQRRLLEAERERNRRESEEARQRYEAQLGEERRKKEEEAEKARLAQQEWNQFMEERGKTEEGRKREEQRRQSEERTIHEEQQRYRHALLLLYGYIEVG